MVIGTKQQKTNSKTKNRNDNHNYLYQSMKCWILKNGYTIYRLLDGRSNSYLICTNNGNILVDTGRKNKESLLLKKLQKNKIGKVDWLILTHTHFDHCGNARFLQEQLKFSAK
jgi:glyoxylase-like metal-dependent hydrolase (beta-lactamase superfamily II)